MGDMMADEKKGTITTDPLLAMPVGAKIRTQSHLFPSTIEPTGWDYYKGTLLQLHFRDGEQERVTGSAVAIAPGTALAALHVISDEIAQVMAGKRLIFASAITSEGLDLWKVRHITKRDGTDLCILSLERMSGLPKDLTIRQAAISRRVPKIGEQVMMAGFRAPEAAPAGPDATTIEGGVYVSVGLVSATYPNGRDSVMIPWPCIELNVGATGGMSGGPAFDSDGRLVGVVCASVGEGAGGTSYVAIVEPILETAFPHCWPSGICASPTALLEMGEHLCSIEPRKIKKA